MKSDRGGGVLPDVVCFPPRNEKIIVALSCRARFSNKKWKTKGGVSLEYSLFLV